MKLQMRAVLDAYCFFRPDIGYVQGMSYLAGKLLLYMGEYDAFVCLANMMESSYFRAMFLMDSDLSDKRYELFESLLADHLPDLYRHFESIDVFMHGKSLYFVEWSMTLFCKRLDLDVVGRIWDLFFLVGEQIVYRTAVAMLQCLRPQLLDKPFEVVHKVLTRNALTLSEEKLIEALGTIKWKKEYEKRLQEISNEG